MSGQAALHPTPQFALQAGSSCDQPKIFLQDVKDVMGFNLAALQHLRRAAQEQSSSMTGASTVKKYRLPVAA